MGTIVLPPTLTTAADEAAANTERSSFDSQNNSMGTKLHFVQPAVAYHTQRRAEDSYEGEREL